MGGGESVFLGDFPEPREQWRDDVLAARWARTWEIRAEVTRALEERRKAGDIGHSLDARVRIGVGASDHELLGSMSCETLAALCIVSQVEIEHTEGAELEVGVVEPLGSKCARCWNYSEAVGSYADHPGICARCYDAVVATS